MNQRIKEVFKFALPIVFGQIGLMLIGTGDVLVAGKFSTEVVAAIGVANGVQGPIIMLGVGLLMGIAPILSQLRGEGVDSSKELKVILVYGVAVSVLLSIINFSIIPFLDSFGFNPKLVPFIKDYLYITGFSFPGMIIFQSLKEYFQSQEKTIFPNALSVFSVIFNIVGNYILVFGAFGFEPIGERGLAYMSVCTRYFMGLCLFIYCWKSLRQSHPFDWKVCKKIFRLSLPISLAILAEVFAFSLTSILVGRMSTIQAAAHNIILNLASVTFMLPLAISSAASVKVGFAFGKKSRELIKEYTLVCVAISMGFMVLTASMFYTIPSLLISQFTMDQDVIAVGVQLLAVVAFFQIFDGLQITLSGILRGFSISKPVLLMTVLAHWCIGCPVGYYLAFYQGQDAFGLWIGLAIGLFVLSMALSIFYKHKLKNLTFAESLT